LTRNFIYIFIYTSHLSHIISVLVIPNEFPTLLAKREIIVNAFVIINIAECQDVIHPLRRLSEKSPEEIIKKSRCFSKNIGTFF